MYKKNKHTTTKVMELLLFAVSIGCLYYSLAQTPLKLWEIVLCILAVILIVLSSQLLILYRFKQCINSKWKR